MKTLYPTPSDPSTDPAYLAGAAVHSLIQPLPSGTAFCIGVVLLVMMTGRLVQTKGSLARAALPFVVHLRWGWHRVERAMERGTFSLDAMFDRAADWCLAHLPIEPVRLGREHREVNAIGGVPAGCGYCCGTSPHPAERDQSAGAHHSKPVFKTPSTPLDLHLSTRCPSTIRSSTHASF